MLDRRASRYRGVVSKVLSGSTWRNSAVRSLSLVAWDSKVDATSSGVRADMTWDTSDATRLNTELSMDCVSKDGISSEGEIDCWNSDGRFHKGYSRRALSYFGRIRSSSLVVWDSKVDATSIGVRADMTWDTSGTTGLNTRFSMDCVFKNGISSKSGIDCWNPGDW